MAYSRNGEAADAALRKAEQETIGAERTIFDFEPLLRVDPFEGAHKGDTACAYGERLDKLYWEDAPIDAQARKSHSDWVNNRKEWSGTSRFKQETIEVSVPSGWRGIRLPEPVPQSCDRAELTEYGPADFAGFVTEQRKRCGAPVISATGMANVQRLPFKMFGF